MGLFYFEDVKYVVEWFGKFLLLFVNVLVDKLVFGLIEVDISFLIFVGKKDIWNLFVGGLNLFEMCIFVVNFLVSGVFIDFECFIFVFYVVFSMDYCIFGIGEDLLKRIFVFLEDKIFVSKFYDVYFKL